MIALITEPAPNASTPASRVQEVRSLNWFPVQAVRIFLHQSVNLEIGELNAIHRAADRLCRSAGRRPAGSTRDVSAWSEAIELTIRCLNPGILQNWKGTVLGTAKPKAQLKNPAWRLLGEDVERRLNRIRESIPASGLPEDPKIMRALERERKEIVESLNAAWKPTGLPLLPLQTEALTIADVFEE